ncbi:MAG: shufflon system plasmid conjugative transfer pilus tip adhesin PilV [Betaproteobacteria bacterium]|nr:shufflon system plasmid conjugative transfer pilus tip adhesin PilV [Betaproteobacteria bacterium]
MPIAILFGLVVMAILLPTLMSATQQNSTIVLGTVAAQQLKQLTSAAQQYIQANFSAVLGASSTTTPATITVPMLIATGFLPQGFQALNPYGQTWQVEALQAPAGQIQALVMSIGGTPVPTRDAARITAQAGAEGGIVGGGTGTLSSPTCAAGQACGAFGGWKIATSGYTGLGPGSLLGLLAFNSAGQLNQQYLYRVAVPGQPQLNQMQTNLDMGNNNINNAQNISASGQIHALGTSTADLPPGWGGGLTTWDLHANATIGAGPSGQNSQAYMNSAATGPLGTGGVVVTQSPNGSQYAYMNANNGGASVVTNGIVQGGYVNSTGNVNAQNALTAGGGFTAQSNGYTRVADTLTVGSRVSLGTAFGGANQGWGCSPNGEIAANANGSGQLMSCVNGIWTNAQGSSFQYVSWGGQGTWFNAGNGNQYFSPYWYSSNPTVVYGVAYDSTCSSRAGRVYVQWFNSSGASIWGPMLLASGNWNGGPDGGSGFNHAYPFAIPVPSGSYMAFSTPDTGGCGAAAGVFIYGVGSG